MSELASQGIPVVVTCRVLTLARAPYYRPLADAEISRAYRAEAPA